MSAQLELTLLSSEPAKQGHKPDWLHDRLRSRAGEPAYHPSRTRKVLMRVLSDDEWKGFMDLPDEVGQSVDQVSRVLDFLLAKGRIEKTPLYFLPHGLLTDRTQHPGYGKYLGFEFGYRLKNG